VEAYWAAMINSYLPYRPQRADRSFVGFYPYYSMVHHGQVSQVDMKLRQSSRVVHKRLIARIGRRLGEGIVVSGTRRIRDLFVTYVKQKSQKTSPRCPWGT
jgi:hypothetical protein